MPVPARAEQSTIGTPSPTSARASSRARAGVGEVGLRHRHDTRAHAERAQHGRVLDRLRHHPVVGGHDEQEQVHAGRAGDHRAHEALVARDVDERQQPAADVELGEAEVDRHAARLLLRQPVGVASGERADERGLAVVDVPGGADRERRVAAHGRLGVRGTERRRSRTFPPRGCRGSPALKAGWATGPGPLHVSGRMIHCSR